METNERFYCFESKNTLSFAIILKSISEWWTELVR